MSRTTSYGFLAPYQSLEKTKDTIPRKSADKQKDKRTDRPISQDPSSYRWGSNIVESGYELY